MISFLRPGRLNGTSEFLLLPGVDMLPVDGGDAGENVLNLRDRVLLVAGVDHDRREHDRELVHHADLRHRNGVVDEDRLVDRVSAFDKSGLVVDHDERRVLWRQEMVEFGVASRSHGAPLDACVVNWCVRD